MNYAFEKLKNADEFELLCCDILNRYYYNRQYMQIDSDIPFFHLYGRKGQSQHGIDIISNEPIDNQGYWVAQCKNYIDCDDPKSLIDTLKKDIDRINQELQFPITRIFLMTAAKRDTKVQDFVAEYNTKNTPKLILLFWDDLERKIGADSQIRNKYYNHYNSQEGMGMAGVRSVNCPKCRDQLIYNNKIRYFECPTCHFKSRIKVYLSKSSEITREQVEWYKKMVEILSDNGFETITMGKTNYDLEAPVVGIQKFMSSCHGCIGIAFRRTRINDGIIVKKYDKKAKESKDEPINDKWYTSPFCHIEPAMAFQRGLPLLIFRENGVIEEGMLEHGNMGRYMPVFDLENDRLDYFDDEECRQLLEQWMNQVADHWDKEYK